MEANETMSVQEAATRLKVGAQKIRTGIISGELPFGWAIKEKHCYSFIIPRARFEACLEGKDLIYANKAQENEQSISQHYITGNTAVKNRHSLLFI